MALRRKSSPFLDIRVGADYTLKTRPQAVAGYDSPAATGDPSFIDIMAYRANQGWTNNFFNNAINSLKISVSPDPSMARFALAMRQRRDTRVNHPNVAKYLAQDPRRAENLGGILGDITQVATSILSDPTTYIGAGAVLGAAKLAGRSAAATGAGIFGTTSALADYTAQYIDSPNIKYSEVAIMGAIGAGLGGLAFRGIGPRQAGDVGASPSATQTPGMLPPPQQPAGLLSPPNPLGDTMTPENYRSVARNLAQKETVAIGDVHTLMQQGIKPLELGQTPMDLPVPYVKKLATEVEGIKAAMQLRVARSAPTVSKLANLLDDTKIQGLKNRAALRKSWRDIEDTWNEASVHTKMDLIEPLKKALATNKLSNASKNPQVLKIINEVKTRQRKLEESIAFVEKTNPWTNPPLQRVGPKRPPKPPKPEPIPVEDMIDKFYMGIPGARTFGINIRDLHEKMPQVPRKKLESTMKRLQYEGLASYDPNHSRFWLADTITNLRKERVLQAEHKRKISQAAQIVKQSGHANQKLLNAVALGSVGAVVGYNYGEGEGAAVGAILGGLAPWTLGKVVGKFSDFTTARTVEGAGQKAAQYINDGNMFISPTKQISRMGPHGKLFMAQLDQAEDMTQLQIADGLVNYRKAKGTITDFTDEEGSLVADLLEAKIKPHEVSPQIRQAAAGLKKVLRKVADDAYAAGLWSEQVYQSAIKNNYFPRVHDEAYLASKEGEDLFVNTMQSINWTEASLRNTLEALTGSRTKANLFIAATRKNGDKFIIDAIAAKQLLKQRGNHVGGSSTHLDHQRKINVGEMDKLLDPFRIRNPDKILDRYLNDVYRRIEHARIFGKDDELALTTLAKIEQDMLPTGKSTPAVKLAREFYMHQKGDTAQSWLLQQHQQASPMLKAVNGKVAAFEVLKLAYSQILQPTSAFVNGSIYMSKSMPMLKSMGTTISTLFKALKPDPVYDEFAQRAASGINVGLIDHISSATSEATLFGRSEFATNRLKWINSPQGFLEAIQFFKVERFTQRWATYQGKALAENLIAKNEQIIAGQITDTKTIKRVRDTMEELGLDWNKSSSQFTTRDMYQASLRFNRTVNFIDGARQLPLVWNSPYASMFRMYKTYSYRQGKFVMDNIVEPMKKGNYKPAAMLLAAGLPAGWTVNTIRDFIKADDREFSNTASLIRNLTMAGGLGYFVDLVNAGVTSDYDVFKTFLGPGPSDALRVTTAIPDTIGGNWRPMAASISRALPEVPGSFKRKLTEQYGITKPFNDPGAAERTFAEELRKQWKAIAAEKKATSTKVDPMKLNLDLSLDLDMGI